MSIVWHVTGLCDIFSSEDYVNGFIHKENNIYFPWLNLIPLLYTGDIPAHKIFV